MPYLPKVVLCSLRFKNGLFNLNHEKENLKKDTKLMHQAQQATGRKEAVGLIQQAAKLKTKFDNYEMIESED